MPKHQGIKVNIISKYYLKYAHRNYKIFKKNISGIFQEDANIKSFPKRDKAV